MRESPAIYMIDELLKRGAKINAYDPKAMNEAKEKYLSKQNIFYGKNKYEILENCDALVLLTECKEFRLPDFDKTKKLMKNNIIFDGRNQYKDFKLENRGFEYFQIREEII